LLIWMHWIPLNCFLEVRLTGAPGMGPGGRYIPDPVLHFIENNQLFRKMG